jgi:DNA polymerase III delta prime subunit
MKFYESHYDEYITSMEQYNLHPELNSLKKSFPKKLSQFGNLILYGPSGTGKYSQALSLIKRYSPSELKYEKKMTLQNEKQTYIYRISDIHYEIDMALLGCNSKIIWHETFSQIVDIVAIKQDKNGIILCKNFHTIHAELLDIFYSYMQQYNHPQLNIHIKFILITEHISFLPNSLIDNCRIIPIRRPNSLSYIEMITGEKGGERTIQSNIEDQEISAIQYHTRISAPKIKQLKYKENILKKMKSIDMCGILNAKETRYFALIKTDFPKDVFNIICNSIIQEMSNPKKIIITEFRDLLYEILIYNLDMTECLWYIISHFIQQYKLNNNHISDVLTKTKTFLKYFNNNYRPIYHLESILFYIIAKIDNYELR